MKLSPRAVLILAGALAAGVLSASAQQNSVTVIPRAPVPDGSNASRAPFPQDRMFDDVKAPDGDAIDGDLPPNTPATQPPAPPAPVVAIFQPDTPAAEATLSMTGRPTVGISSSLEANRVAGSIRGQQYAAREQLFSDIDTRLNSSASALRTIRGTANQMSSDAREQFDDAAEDLRDKERALRKSLKAAKKANAQEWESARAQLAADYEAYAAAAARIDALAGIQNANP